MTQEVASLPPRRFHHQSSTIALMQCCHQLPPTFAATVIGWLLHCCPPPTFPSSSSLSSSLLAAPSSIPFGNILRCRQAAVHLPIKTTTTTTTTMRFSWHQRLMPPKLGVTPSLRLFALLLLHLVVNVICHSHCLCPAYKHRRISVVTIVVVPNGAPSLSRNPGGGQVGATPATPVDRHHRRPSLTLILTSSSSSSSSSHIIIAPCHPASSREADDRLHRCCRRGGLIHGGSDRHPRCPCHPHCPCHPCHPCCCRCRHHHRCRCDLVFFLPRFLPRYVVSSRKIIHPPSLAISIAMAVRRCNTGGIA